MSSLVGAERAAGHRRLPPQPRLAERLQGQFLATRLDAVLAVVIVLGALYFVPAAIHWMFVDSVTVADSPRACRDTAGACWGVVYAHIRVILFGLYPFAEQWRAAAALAVVALALAASFVLGAKRPGRIALLWLIAAILFFTLMRGGVAGLTSIPAEDWGGLPLSVFVFLLTILLGFPIAVLLALGRGSSLPAVRIVCTAAIEVVRAMPVLTILFTAAIVVPLMLPGWLDPGKLYRVAFAMAFFYACFQAEIIRGGLQGVPAGQRLAALSLGLTRLQTRLYVELPQALRYTVPATMNQVVVALKDTSMLLVVGLFDFMASANTAISKDEWVRYFPELYVFVAAVFLVMTTVLNALRRRFVDAGRG